MLIAKGWYRGGHPTAISEDRGTLSVHEDLIRWTGRKHGTFVIPLLSVVTASWGLPSTAPATTGPNYRTSIFGMTPLIGGLRAEESAEDKFRQAASMCLEVRFVDEHGDNHSARFARPLPVEGMPRRIFRNTDTRYRATGEHLARYILAERYRLKGQAAPLHGESR